jgi:hypothetical protein
MPFQPLWKASAALPKIQAAELGRRYPGRLYVPSNQFAAYQASIDRVAAFTKDHPVIVTDRPPQSGPAVMLVQ